MTVPLNPGDAPFDTTTIPNGWTRVLTQEEADAANLLYPVPPYGFFYTPPGPPVAGANVKFVILKNAAVAGVGQSQWEARAADMDTYVPNTTFVAFWPIAGVLGIVDDVGVRPARVMAVDVPTNKVTLNYDIAGLDVTGLVVVGVIYTGAQT